MGHPTPTPAPTPNPINAPMLPNVETTLTSKATKSAVQKLSELEYRLCTPELKGFSLSSNEWSTFFVDSVHEITFSIDAFPRLVLRYDYKELILAFATNQLSSNDTFDDVIKGKGQGMTILLHGEPGVGKTLIVEATSEEMRKPLYIMSAGELGYSASEVEDKLRKVLDVITKWGGILLIDECDIFLEKRTVSDIERNKLVAIFLRALEYFKGIMFLTANRIGTFDAAFQSRIHLTINYPALDFESCKHIWKTFLPGTSGESDVEKVPRHVISKSDIFDLALIALNGREIKNIVKSARLLSASKQVPLSMNHIGTVLRVKGILLAEE